MGIEDKVIRAYPMAERMKRVDALLYDTNGIFLTLEGKNMVQFEANSDATLYKVWLNSATKAARASMNDYFKVKINGILDA